MPMLTQENPFQLGPFVDGEIFADRKEEASKVIQSLSGHNHLVLIHQPLLLRK